MRKFFYFIGISCLNAMFFLYNKLAWGQGTFETATTKYGAQIRADRILLVLGIFLGIVWGVFRLIRFIWRNVKTKRNKK